MLHKDFKKKYFTDNVAELLTEALMSEREAYKKLGTNIKEDDMKKEKGTTITSTHGPGETVFPLNAIVEFVQKRPETIEIREITNGFILNIGCKTIVIQGDHKKLLKELDLFYSDYDKAYRKYMKED